MNTTLSPMELQLQRALLKYAVQHAISCPVCKHVLDCKRAVSLDWLDANEELQGTKTVCASCYDAKLAGGKLERMTEGTAFHVQVWDGRVLFARNKVTQ